MLSSNGYRTFQMTKASAIARARKAIASYQAHLSAGVSADHAKALNLFIQGQEEVIAEWNNMRFHPGEW